MTLENFNNLSFEAAYAELQKCCGAKKWIDRMVNARPFFSSQHLFEKADTIWNSLSPSDWKEAFSHHLRIGDLKDDNRRVGSSTTLAQEEQSSVKNASSLILNDLSRLNIEYERKFGYIFIVYATGKTAAEMLGLLLKRIDHAPDREIVIAAEEQRKITRLRLEKLFTPV